MSKVLLFSGGMDSTALAAWKRPELLLTIDYGQRPAAGELRAARVISEELGLPLRVVRIDCSSLGSGDLAGTTALNLAPASDWWPFRNQLLITLAASIAVAEGADELMIASVRSDEVHADGRSTFVEAMDRLLLLQEGNLRLSAPALMMSTAELVRASGIMSSVLAWGHSCHVAPWACGQCRGCYKHMQVNRELGYE